MQKFSSLLLALIACAGIMFADGTKIGDLYYNLNADNKTAEVTYQEWHSNYSYLTAINIPESVEYNSVTYRVTSIGELAFVACSGLTSVTIPNSVTSIGEQAFAYCSALTSIEIPNSVTNIGEHAFEYCRALTSVTIPNSVTSIGYDAFYECSGLMSIEIPNSVTSIGGSAFSGCTSLTSIVVASGNTNYDSRENCNAIIETASNTLIAGCKNTIIPNSVTIIGEVAFVECSGLTSIEIPNSVTSIGAYAFSGCSGLSSVTIPNSVTSIGGDAFSECSGLTSVTNYAVTPQTINSYVFYNVNKSSCTLYVPEGSINLYKAADGWKDFTNIQAIDETQTSIDQITNNQTPVTNKIIKDGQVFILRGDKTYTVTGQQRK